jgi:hypothetical protein
VVPEDRDSADVDVDAFRHVDIGVAEGREGGHGRLPVIDGGLTQVEVEIPEDTGGDRPPAQR